MSSPDPVTGATTAEDVLGPHLGRRYRILECVGHGGMATVYRAHDQQLDRDVALKVFHPGLTSPEDLLRQQAEIRHFAGLTHPSLVTLYDAVTDQDGRTVLVLEYVSGRDLRSRLARGPIGPATVAAVGRDIARALAHIHSRDVVHRDVSPGNILLPDRDSNDHGVAAKLTDLGIARFVDSGRITATGTLIGTAAYLSPEQVRGDQLTVASDIYSLGLVLLECLVGRREFGGSATEAALARLTRDPQVPDHLPEEWRRLLISMTARDAADRPSAIATAQALEDVVATMAISPATELIELPTLAPTDAPAEGTDATRVLPPPTDLADPDRGRSRARWLLAALAGTVLLLVLVVVFAAGAGPSSHKPPSPAPHYPAIPGQLGTHLRQLEQAVSPQVRQ